MKKRFFTLFLTIALVLTMFIPATQAEYVTMYASDGRTATVYKGLVEAWKNVGWYESAEDAEIITMYSMDGRTLEIPQYYRKAHNAVGWYDTKEEVQTKMYATDGRTITVFKDEVDAYRKVGWYDSIDDVTVKMYDSIGTEYTIFKDHVQKELENGLTLESKLQLMFSADGKFISVQEKDIEAYNKVGWYTAGSETVDKTKPMVALTFDDGPGKYTDRVLSILEKYNVRATFFVQGQYVSKYEDVLNRAIDLGSEIGNHTWSHVNLTSGVGNQISRTNEAVYNATGVYPKVYRPPYGSYNKSVLNSISMPAIMWSVDTLDWKTRNASKTLQSVQKDTRDGAIILMHDIHEPTADAVEPVVKWLLMNGYQLVTVSELIEARSGSAVNGKVYTKLAP